MGSLTSPNPNGGVVRSRLLRKLALRVRSWSVTTWSPIAVALPRSISLERSRSIRGSVMGLGAGLRFLMSLKLVVEGRLGVSESFFLREGMQSLDRPTLGWGRSASKKQPRKRERTRDTHEDAQLESNSTR